MSDPGIGGLREQKKRLTQQAIERGAIDLVLEHGYERVTVEMICERAVISQRTFFNYAGSKERAVLGIDTPLPSEERRAAFIAGMGGSPLRDLVATITAAFSDHGASDHDLFRTRRKIIRDNPELAMREFARMEEAHSTIIDLARDRLDADSPGADAQGLDDEARMIVSLTFGIVHYVVRDWMSEGTVISDLTGALQQAVDLARRVAGR